MSVYLYRALPSFAHKWHPVTKLAFLLFVFGVAVTFAHPAYVGALFIFVLVFGLLCGAGPNFRRLLPLISAIALFSLILWPIFMRREAQEGAVVLFRLGAAQFCLREVLYGLAMALRIASMLFAGLIYLTIARPEEFSHALESLGFPYRFAFVFSLAFRLVPLFMSSAATVVLAQKGRGLELERGSPWARLKKYVPLFVPILVSAVRRGDQLAAALEARGFGRAKKRTLFPPLPFSPSDLAWCAGFFIILAVCIIARCLGWGGYKVLLG